MRSQGRPVRGLPRSWRVLSGDSKTDPLEPKLTYTPIIHW